MGDWDLDTPPRGDTRRDDVPGETGMKVSSGPARDLQAEPATDGAVAKAAGSMTGGSAATKKLLGGRFPVALVLGALLLLAVGLATGFFVAYSRSAEDRTELAEAREEVRRLTEALSDAETRNWQHYLSIQALEAELEGLLTSTTIDQSGTSTGVTPSSGPGQVYDDGVYLVGEDIAVGSYDGVVVGDVGYWARLKATDGLVSSIVANGLPRGPFVLTIITSDVAVELRGVRLTAR
jgi:hypothetical protein